MGGMVGSNENMWSQRRAFIHKARLSTSLAMGPLDDNTNVWMKTQTHKRGKYPWFIINNLLTKMIPMLLTGFLPTNNGRHPLRADRNARKPCNIYDDGKINLTATVMPT